MVGIETLDRGEMKRFIDYEQRHGLGSLPPLSTEEIRDFASLMQRVVGRPVPLGNPSEISTPQWLSVRRSVRSATARSGKWLLYMTKSKVDEVWTSLRAATVRGELGCEAKVSTAHALAPHGRHVICIYTYDYKDIEDVMRVRRRLRELGSIRKIPYKADKTTLKGLYGEGTSMYYSDGTEEVLQVLRYVD